jgi:MoaA/NifB/PqqE/SkfB family radical SAM enzyme
MQLHIETTNRCFLACPACPRTQWRELTKMPVAKQDLVVDDLEKFLDCDGGKKIDHFLLCGDYGDTIYYPELFDLLERFRSTKSFTIATNGSNQTEKFWNRLAEILTPNDTITFGIDGLEDTNHLYRKNANWNSVMMAVDIMSKSSAKVRWQTIVFSFNYNKLDKIKELAESKGADFYCIKTHRYGDDGLRPPSDAFVQVEHLFKNDYVSNHNIVIDPRCEIEKVVTCEGMFYPCDWIRNPQTLYKSQLWKQQQQWLSKLKIKDTNYDQAMLVVKDWANYVRENSVSGTDKVDVLCKMKCRQGCSQERRLSI